MNTSPTQYGNIDWERVRKVLVVRAAQLRRIVERVVDGTTTDDLASEVIIEFYNHRNRMGWEPKKGPLEWFLVRVLDRRWIDHCRREAKAGGSLDDSDTVPEPLEQPQNPLADLEHSELLERIRELAKNDPELVEMVDAIELLDGDYHLVNQQVAELIGTTVKDVENRKKRLRRALGKLWL